MKTGRRAHAVEHRVAAGHGGPTIMLMGETNMRLPFFFGIGVETMSEVDVEGMCMCPHCNAVTSYTRLRLEDYATLFGFKMSRLRVRTKATCDRCGEELGDLTEVSADYVRKMHSPWNCASCGRTNVWTDVCCPVCKCRPPSTAGSDGTPPGTIC